jgi:hypothetical protein
VGGDLLRCRTAGKRQRSRGSLAGQRGGRAREAGADAVEGYPVDLSTSPPEAAERLYAGSLTTFLARGFTQVARLGPHNVLVELNLLHS